MQYLQRCCQEFSLAELYPWESGATGSRGEALVRHLEKAEAVCRHFLQILTAETIKI